MEGEVMRPQRPCNQPHGTNARYNAGCHCFVCRVAHSEYWRERIPAVPAERVRAHIEKLVESGLTQGYIAASSGIMEQTVRDIRKGVTKRVRSVTAEALYAVVPVPCSLNAFIPAAPTQRVIARLRRRHTCKEISKASGISVNSIVNDIPVARFVRASTAMKFEDAARRLGDTCVRVDAERYHIERALGVPVEAAAELAEMDVRTAWRLERFAVTA